MDRQVASDSISEIADHSSDTKSNSSRLMSWLSSVWDTLVQSLTRNHELKVWKKRTSADDIFYCAYDPYTGQTAYLTSDTDLRSWLESLPYQ